MLFGKKGQEDQESQATVGYNETVSRQTPFIPLEKSNNFAW